MGKNVFANNLEVSGKASGYKVIASMPDVCLSPPSPPAGPIPIPYPNFSQASDTTGGTKKVKVGGKEVGMKGKSSYKKSKGDEAATRSFGGGVVSHNITGPVKHKLGSFDVKVEGSAVVRFTDLTTGNHINAGNACMVIDAATAGMSMGKDADCKALGEKNKEARKDLKKAPTAKTKKAGSESCTITTAAFKPKGARKARMMKASSSQEANLFDNAFAEGDKDKRRKKSRACGGEVHKYKTKAGKGRAHQCHAESRIIEEIFKAYPEGGGKLVLQIDWPGGAKKKGRTRRSPCKNCQDLICAASKPPPGCMEIMICNTKNKAKKPKCS